MNKTLINTIFYSIGEVLPKIISFLLLPVLTRYLSPSDYGITAYTNTINVFLTIIGSLCLNSYVLRYYFIHNDEESHKSVIGTAFITIGVFNLFIIGLAYLFLPSIIERYNIQVLWDPYFKLAIFTNLLTSFCTIPLALYRIKQKANKYVLLNVSRTVLNLSLTVLFVVFLKKGVVGFFYANLLAIIPFVPIYFVIIGKQANFHFSFTYLKEGLKFAMPLVPGALAYAIINMSDRIILERNVDMELIGLYNVAVTMSLALNIVIQSGYHAFEPEIFSHYGKEGYYRYVKKIQKVFYSAIFVMGLCIALFSQEAFHYFTSEHFHRGFIYTPILILTAMISGQNIIYSCVLQGDRKSKTVGAITLVGSFCSITLNLLLIPYLGVWAAAITGTASMYLMNVMQFVAMKFEDKSMAKEIILSLLVVVISYVIFYFFPTVSLQGFTFKILGILLYLVVMCLLYDFNWQSIKSFKMLIKKKSKY